MLPTRLVMSLFLALLVVTAGCGDNNSSEPEPVVTESPDPENPFFVASPLPYGLPPFDKINDNHYIPAFELGMAEEISEVEAIATNPAAATFENTIVALEQTGSLLTRTQRVFSAMTSAHTNDNLKKIQTEMAPKFAAHNDSIALNPELFARVDSLFQQRDKLDLDAESRRLLERYHTDFVRAGARLSDEEKARLREINALQAELSTAFSQNVLNEVNESAIVVDSRDELERSLCQRH